MSRLLGISVGSRELHAVLAHRGRVLWAGAIPYQSPDDVADAIARLAGEAPAPAKRTRVVLARDVVQLRSIEPAPPLNAAAARRYVMFEAPRLFRLNGCPLVTDARVLHVDGRRVLWAAAAPQPLVEAIVKGSEEAGLTLEALGPASEVLPWALAERREEGDFTVPLGPMTERLSVARSGVWRSRLVREPPAQEATWAEPLRGAGDQAPAVARAYAATQRRPRLDLLPGETQAARARAAWRRLRLTARMGLGVSIAAAVVYLGRLGAASRDAARQLAVLRPSVDSVLALRRDLAAARSALATMQTAERKRSRTLLLLAQVTGALGDSTFLAAFELGQDSTLRLVGYAPQAARTLAQLEKIPALRDTRFDVPVTREVPGAGQPQWDRFSVLARIRGVP